MRFRIKVPNFEADPLHTFWVAVYAVCFGIAWSLFGTLLVHLTNPGGIYITPLPFIMVGGDALAQALDRFSGKELVVVWGGLQTATVIQLVIYYIVAPTAFVWGLNERALWRQQTGERKFPWKIVLSLGTTATIIVSIVLGSLVPPLIHYRVRVSVMEAQRIQANRDALMWDLNYAALRAQSFYFVDVKDGGGGGRWKNIQRKGNPTLTIDEIAPPEPVVQNVAGKLFPQQPSKFRLEVHTADSLVVYGIAVEDGDNADFANADGQKGKIQFSIGVMPKKIKFTSEN
jgi:hypothetical protein